MTRNEQVQMDKLEAEIIRLRYANGKLLEDRTAHDRAVAARVLYAIRRYVDDCSSDKISEIAAQYEAGKREVPGE